MLDQLSHQEGQLTLVSILRALPQETLNINLGTLGAAGLSVSPGPNGK